MENPIKSVSWQNGQIVCRCCLAEGCYKDIGNEYFWMGKREVYEEMLSETFDLKVSRTFLGNFDNTWQASIFSAITRPN